MPCARPASGVPRKPPAMSPVIRVANRVPKTAIPVAMPTWRNVVLMPEAIPAAQGGTRPTAVAASAGLTRPDPTPATISPGNRWVQPEAGPAESFRDEEHCEQHRHGRQADHHPGVAPASLPGPDQPVDTTRSTRYLTERIASLDGVTALEVAPIIRTVKRAAMVVPAG
jgi:hypothetical protein